MHRIYHYPYLYKKFHKVHHKYVQPTAFSVTAIHPVEIINVQFTIALPMFVIPVHWGKNLIGLAKEKEKNATSYLKRIYIFQWISLFWQTRLKSPKQSQLFTSQGVL